MRCPEALRTFQSLAELLECAEKILSAAQLLIDMPKMEATLNSESGLLTLISLQSANSPHAHYRSLCFRNRKSQAKNLRTSTKIMGYKIALVSKCTPNARRTQDYVSSTATTPVVPLLAFDEHHSVAMRGLRHSVAARKF